MVLSSITKYSFREQTLFSISTNGRRVCYIIVLLAVLSSSSLFLIRSYVYKVHRNIARFIARLCNTTTYYNKRESSSLMPPRKRIIIIIQTLLLHTSDGRVDVTRRFSGRFQSSRPEVKTGAKRTRRKISY